MCHTIRTACLKVTCAHMVNEQWAWWMVYMFMCTFKSAHRRPLCRALTSCWFHSFYLSVFLLFGCLITKDCRLLNSRVANSVKHLGATHISMSMYIPLWTIPWHWVCPYFLRPLFLTNEKQLSVFSPAYTRHDVHQALKFACGEHRLQALYRDTVPFISLFRMHQIYYLGQQYCLHRYYSDLFVIL